MAKRKKNRSKTKFKASIKNVVRKLFEQNPDLRFTHKQVCAALNIKESPLRKLVYEVLQLLAREQFLRSYGHGDFQFNQQSNFIVGYLDLTTRGAGFVSNEEREADIYVAPPNVGQCLPGDLVKVQIIKRGSGRWEGIITEVIEREITQIVGTIEMHEKFAFLVPDNSRIGKDIYISKEQLKGAKDGDRALARITVWPKSADSPYGEIIEVLSGNTPNDNEMLQILCNHGIDFIFPPEVLKEAQKIKMELDEEEIKKNRRDMRDTLTFTIDPFDAKDFDDALSLKKLDNGRYEIGVHIADVSHYVKDDSPMDIEALKRSNSVYLVDRVIPMLPEQLSNMACSLRPNEDKYAFSAVFEMDDKGKVYDQWFGKTAIHSNRRFTYEEAQDVIEKGEGDLVEEIQLFDKIAKILRKKRLKSGALSIESEEVKFRLDDEGYPDSIEIKRSKDANKLIEEFMLLANRSVAKFMGYAKDGKKAHPFIYRVHDQPDAGKIEVFKTFIHKFGHSINTKSETNIANEINNLLEGIRENSEYGLIQSMAIRSMAKATYEVENIGHYGLAFDFYSHFTSPIRRYADLMVHRMLEEVLKHGKHAYEKKLPEIAKRISRLERKASEAERESTKFFQVLFVQDKVGEVFLGTVSGITEHGMYVRMDENYCEGMVPMNEIPGDNFYFDPDKYHIIGRRHGDTFNIGDKVHVRIYEVHPRKRQIDLEIAELD